MSASTNLDLVRSICADWERGDFKRVEWADWAGVSTTADDYRELDGERILVFSHYTGRGRTRGVELGEMRSNVAALFQMRGDKVTRLTLWRARDRALADLRLAAVHKVPASCRRSRSQAGLRH